MNVLVDTSVWSLSLRRKIENLSFSERQIASELAELIHEGRARIMGLIRQELLSGVKTSDQYERLRTALRVFPDEFVETPDYEAAAQANNQCRTRGITASPVDMLICAVASAQNFSILTTDPDFQSYARILPIKLHAIRKPS